LSSVTFPKKDLIIGEHANRKDIGPVTWNPDSHFLNNQHMLMCGKSGAGKSIFFKEIAKYLVDLGKHVIIPDLKGDMIFEDSNGNRIGNYIEFTTWGSEYGINPFEFDIGVGDEKELQSIINNPSSITPKQNLQVKNAGPKVQIEIIIELIKKNYLPNMGSRQEIVIRYLLRDVYAMKGFEEEKIETWLNPLPSMNDVVSLIEKLLVYFDKKPTKKTKTSIEHYAILKDAIVNLKFLKQRYSLCAENNNEEKEKLEKTIQEKKSTIDSLHKEYIEYGLENFNESDMLPHNMGYWFFQNNIDISHYEQKGIMNTVADMSSYFRGFVDAGIFHSNKPPMAAGLNVMNISGLDVSHQKFFVDIMLGKGFRACKARGEYSKLPPEKKRRGEKCDTVYMIDESKLISGTSKEKNNPFSYLNRIATEARAFGMALVVASQSAEHFPPEFLKNFSMQVVFNTEIADYDNVKKAFGLTKEELTYTQLKPWGNVLVKAGREFAKVRLRNMVVA